jgi:hypothetical protein
MTAVNGDIRTPPALAKSSGLWAENGVTCLVARALAPWRAQEKSEGGGILNARSRRKMGLAARCEGGGR